MVRKLNHFRINRHRTTQKRCLKHFKHGLFINDLESVSWENIADSNPNRRWEKWKAVFLNIVDKHAPLKQSRLRNRRSPWLTRDIVSLMRKRDLLKCKAMNTNESNDWIEYKKARNTTNNVIKQSKASYYKEACILNKDNPRKLWSTINEVCGRSSKSSHVKTLEIGQKTLTDDPSISEAFNEHFSEIGPKLIEAVESDDTAKSFLEYVPITDKVFGITPICPAKVLQLFLNLSDRKASGLDNISSKLLKVAAPVIATSITDLFNCSISTGVFPDEWKLARVVPVFKKGIRSDVNNYRPTSIIPIIARVFEKAIYDQFYKYLADNSMLSNCQSGFRKLHNTMTTLLKSTDEWRLNIDKGQINGVVFIDLKKAFDTVDHSILIDKMRRYGLNEQTLNFFTSYLENRSQRCFVNGHLSQKVSVRCGVPQGSILGPLLFLIFINDLPNCFDTAKTTMYADDTTLTFCASDTNSLESQINSELKQLNQWLVANKLTLNVSKTELMIITTRQKRTFIDDTLNVNNSGQPVNRVMSVNMLGLQLEQSLSWTKHKEHIYKKVAPALGLLKRVRDFVDRDTLVSIYNALILPHLEYACVVWDGLDKGLAIKLQRLQNRAARIITRSSWEIRSCDILSELGWLRLDKRRYNQKKKLMNKIMNGKAPTYLEDLFRPKETVNQIELRDSINKLAVPLPKTDCYKQSISYSGSILWNNLATSERIAGNFFQS